MDALFKKLNYKDQKRIALINSPENFNIYAAEKLTGVQIDYSIDPRYPYEFMIVFAEQVSEVEKMAPKALHNLVSDGVLWFAYPKKSSRKSSSDLDRDHGWVVLIDRGFDKVRQVAIDKEWSALRFRNVRFIKSSK